MNITFDKSLKQRVFQLVRSSLHDKDSPHCPFCDNPVRAKNFAGAALINGQLRAFHGNFFCLLGYVDSAKRTMIK